METKNFIERYKEGLLKITPQQQLEASQKGNWVALIGYVAGIIVMLFNLKSWWWIEFILVAGLFNHLIMMLGIWQKIKAFRNIEKMMEDVEKELKGGVE